MRLFAIGDIHGCYAALLALDAELRFGVEDCVITLGDYVDRGPDSRLVLEHLIELSKRSHLVPLLGNHETMLLGARKGRVELQDWTDAGGNATLKSYRGQTLDSIPTRHWQFLEACHRFHVAERDFFVHANADATQPLAEQSDDMLFWESFGSPPAHCSGRRMICGHTEQRSGRPLNLGHAVCIDTLAYGNGWLTCLDINSGTLVQANQSSQVRVSNLSQVR